MKSKDQPQNVLTACKPRAEVLQGELDDAIFAADFGKLVEGTPPKIKVYEDPKTFFSNTEPTPDLKAVCAAVFRALGDKKEGGQLIRLSTGFGGGKTHTLMALWHLAKNVDDLSVGAELLPAAGRPSSVKVVGIDGAKAGVPIFGTHGQIKTRSLQGELAYQLGGVAALKSLGEVDNPEASPDESTLTKMLGNDPVLILLDELVIYMAGLTTTGQGNFMSFIGKLISVVNKRKQSVLVITDPGQQAAYANVSAQITAAIGPAAVKLDDILGRKMTDFDPVGKQAAKVIARRLFDKIDPKAAAAASANYHQLYSRVRDAHPELLPTSAASNEYALRIQECYPFHPRLIDTAKERLGPLPEFQRSRGVLRLFARIIREVWNNKRDVELISAGDIAWDSKDIRSDLLQRLRKEQFGAAVDADVEGHAKELDDNKPDGIHYRVASALLLESLPRNEHSGLDPAELTLAILRTSEAGDEPSQALDRLVGACWHTYPLGGNKGWQFRFDPNVIKQIEQRAATVDAAEARDRVQSEAQGFFGGPRFALASWPETARDVQERPELQLALCASVEIAEQVCAYADRTDPSAPIPRRYRNAIVAVAPTKDALANAMDRARRLIAAEAIERDSRNGETAGLVREQMGRVKPNLAREFKLQTARAFDTVVRAEGAIGRIEEKYQVSDEDILSKPQGQKCLQAFLEEKELIYKADDSLDPDRFLKIVLSGTTPVPGQVDVHSLSDVHERFLSAMGLRLVSGVSIVRQTILKALKAGKVVLRTIDGAAFDKNGCVAGREGQRRRIDGAAPNINLKDDELITRASSAAAGAWLVVDPVGKPGVSDDTKPGGQDKHTVEEAPTVRVENWVEAIEFASARPLMQLVLRADTPAIAESLVSLAQPFGADELKLDVTVQGDLKSGGRVDFQAAGVKPTSPVRPLESAKTLFNAMQEGMNYEAQLALTFREPGRSSMASQLDAMSDKADGSVSISATFGSSDAKGGTKK